MLRMNRPLASGVVRIKDRKPSLDENGNPVEGKYDVVYKLLGRANSPTPKMEKVQVMAKTRMGEWDLDENGEKKPHLKDGKPVYENKQARGEGGKYLWDPAEGFEVNDEDHVLENHGAILERC